LSINHGPNKPPKNIPKGPNPYELTSDCVVLACSGPSLNKVDVFSLGYPVIAVSTAVRSDQFKERPPDIWAVADKLNNMHGDEGQRLWRDPSVLKVMPELRRKDLRKLKNLEDEELLQWYFCPYQHQRDKSRNLKWEKQGLFSGKMPLLRGCHKSVTFALQWAHFMGAKTIIWAGCDLTAKSIKDKYAYQTEEKDLGKRGGYLRTLNVVDKQLREWYPVAQKKGFEWYNWECGEQMRSIGIPPFLGKGNEKKILVTIPKAPSWQPMLGGEDEVHRRQPVREITSRQSRRRKTYKPTKINNSSIPAGPPEEKIIGLVDKYGRSIAEPFADPEPIEHMDESILEQMANMPDEPHIKGPVFVEDERERRKINKELRQSMRERNIKLRQKIRTVDGYKKK